VQHSREQCSEQREQRAGVAWCALCRALDQNMSVPAAVPTRAIATLPNVHAHVVAASSLGQLDRLPAGMSDTLHDTHAHACLQAAAFTVTACGRAGDRSPAALRSGVAAQRVSRKRRGARHASLPAMLAAAPSMLRRPDGPCFAHTGNQHRRMRSPRTAMPADHTMRTCLQGSFAAHSILQPFRETDR